MSFYENFIENKHRAVAQCLMGQYYQGKLLNNIGEIQIFGLKMQRNVQECCWIN